MSHLKSTLLISLFSISLYCGCFSQERHYLEPYVNPFVYRLGEINKQFILQESEFVGVNYVNHPSYELGLQYRFNIKPKLGLILGISNMFSKYEISSFSLYRPRRDGGELYPSYTMSTYSRVLDIKHLGGKIGLNYQISDRISIGLSINYFKLNFTHYFNKNPYPEDLKFGMSGSNNVDDHSFEFDVEIRTGYNIGLTLPEIDIAFKITENLTFKAGFRWRFWKNNEDGDFFNIKVTGSPDRVNVPGSLLHHSSAAPNTLNALYMFTGIKYAIPMSLFSKKSKSIDE